MDYIIVHKILEHPWILVIMGVLEPVPHRYWGIIAQLKKKWDVTSEIQLLRDCGF